MRSNDSAQAFGKSSGAYAAPPPRSMLAVYANLAAERIVGIFYSSVSGIRFECSNCLQVNPKSIS